MSVLDQLIEERIRAAVERGELSGLPGEGRPLPDEDLSLVPEELRMAIRVLRNAGIVPPAVADLRELRSLVAELASNDVEAERRRALGRLTAIVARLEAAGLSQAGAAAMSDYREAVLRRLAGTADAGDTPDETP